MKPCLAITFLCVLLTIIASCQSEGQIEFNRYYTSGVIIYQTRCQNCHGIHGEGLLGLIPPLTDSAYLKVNKARLACMVKNGLKNKIRVAGKSYEGPMPANELTPIEIAQVLTYISNSFNNKLGLINAQQVSQDLQGCN